MESRTQRSRPRTQKNPRPRLMTDFSRTDPVEALDRNSRGQGQGHKNSVVLKIFLICARFEAISEKKRPPCARRTANFPQDLGRSLQFRSVIFVFNESKKCCPWIEDRHFRELRGFEAKVKDFKTCSWGLHYCLKQATDYQPRHAIFNIASVLPFILRNLSDMIKRIT